MSEWLIVLAVVLVLVLLNGLFVAAEFAIIGSSRPAMAARAEHGDRLAARVVRIHNDPVLIDRYVATAQLGITFASLGLGMYGEHTLAMLIEGVFNRAGFEGFGAWLGAHGVAVAVAITAMTYLHIVLGEMIPKSLALTHATQTALWVTRPMLVIGLVLMPLVRLLNWMGNTLLGLVGFVRGRGAAHLGAGELESVARESLAGGVLAEESGRTFQRLVDFNLTTAAEAMLPRVRAVGLPLDVDADGLRQVVARHRHTRYPVYEGDLDHVVGTVHTKDLIALLVHGRRLADLSLRTPAYVPQTAPLDDVLMAMRRSRNQMAVVMDEHGGTAGFITMEDICAEAVGDIEEGREGIPDALPVGAHRHQVQGTLRLDTLGERLGRELEHPDVDTVSGLVLSELGRPPQVGDCVHWQGLEVQVSRLHGHGVRQAIVVDHGPPGEAGDGDGDDADGEGADPG